MPPETGIPSIRYLADVPEALPVLIRWFIEEWEPYYGPAGPGDAETDLRSSMNRDRLPICLVALDEAGTPVGTVSLKSESVSHRHLEPWVAAFVVVPSQRRSGIGARLLAAVEDEARRLRYRHLYLSSDVMAGLLEHRGWRAFDETATLRGRVKVYSLDL